MAAISQMFQFYKSAYRLRRGRLPEHNVELFDRSSAVDLYRDRAGLTGCERYLCEKYIAPDVSVLDVGVGTGRTTGELVSVAGDYVGIDLSPGMVDAARDHFPDVRFEVMDASVLEFADGSFDAILFSYNGIDYLYPDEKRRTFLDEAARVLSPEGVLIFSSHNARALFVETSKDEGPARRWWDATRGTFRRIALYGSQPAAWRGRGYVVDPRYEGLVVNHATPRRVGAEVAERGFRLVEAAANDHPSPVRPWKTRSIYYVCRKNPSSNRALA